MKIDRASLLASGLTQKDWRKLVNGCYQVPAARCIKASVMKKLRLAELIYILDWKKSESVLPGACSWAHAVKWLRATALISIWRTDRRVIQLSSFFHLHSASSPFPTGSPFASLQLSIWPAAMASSTQNEANTDGDLSHSKDEDPFIAFGIDFGTT